MLLKVTPEALFAAIPDALRLDWYAAKASLNQICPQVRHETSAVRNEVIRLLTNWCKQCV